MEKPTSSAQKKSLTVLLVDDTTEILESLGMHFERAGHKVWTAKNGKLALETLDGLAGQGVSIDVVVTDNEMPVMDGVMLVAILREQGFLGKVIIHCTQLTPGQQHVYDQMLKVNFVFRKSDPKVTVKKMIWIIELLAASS